MHLKNPFLFQEFTKKPKQASKQANKKNEQKQVEPSVSVSRKQ